MIPLTTKLPAICSLLQRVLEMEESQPEAPWEAAPYSHRVLEVLGPKERHIAFFEGERKRERADFIVFTRNITKPQATALLLAIEALSLTAWVSFGSRDNSYLGSKAYDTLQSIADAFPDALFQDSSRCA